MLGEVRDLQGALLVTAPRELLKKIINRVNELGYRSIIGAEMENSAIAYLEMVKKFLL
ncbi:hypothetical protein [Cellulosilyticum ruminicola]|uniref:hypothetical protein n=1 Tax=Cellulosilyticum ruminicola TaxID=425254 RepID=UPI0012ECBE37|nr:hypothetical protein [Cellulosilyticum ruminicola]